MGYLEAVLNTQTTNTDITQSLNKGYSLPALNVTRTLSKKKKKTSKYYVFNLKLCKRRDFPSPTWNNFSIGANDIDLRRVRLIGMRQNVVLVTEKTVMVAVTAAFVGNALRLY